MTFKLSGFTLDKTREHVVHLFFHLFQPCCRYTWQGAFNLKGTIERLQSTASATETCTKSEQQQASRSTAAPERKEKSLGLLAQKFVQMLLCAPSHSAIALEDAATSLLGMCSLHTTPPCAWWVCRHTFHVHVSMLKYALETTLWGFCLISGKLCSVTPRWC